MSADNVIYEKQAKHFQSRWYVLECSASVPADFTKAKVYNSREKALVAAHDLQKEIGYVEYGVNEIR